MREVGGFRGWFGYWGNEDYWAIGRRIMKEEDLCYFDTYWVEDIIREGSFKWLPDYNSLFIFLAFISLADDT